MSIAGDLSGVSIETLQQLPRILTPCRVRLAELTVVQARGAGRFCQSSAETNLGSDKKIA